MQKFASSAYGTLGAGIGTGDATISLTAGHGARFPALSAGDYFDAALVDASNNIEYIRVTARATDTLTALRAQDGSTARAYSAGDRIELRFTKSAAESAKQESATAITLAGTDTYTGTLSPKPTAYNTDQVYWFKFPNTNTAADPTVNLSSLGTKTLKASDGSALAAGDLPTTVAVPFSYDGTNMRMVDRTFSGLMPKSGGTFTGSVTNKFAPNLASASTIDLTALAGNACHITGTTQINAVTLAAGKSVDVIFDGALVLAHHATNNNLPTGANITTVAGDRARYISDGTTVYLLNYQRADGSPLMVAQQIPPGIMFDYAGSGPVPAGYLLADGSAVSRTTYAALFAAIGTTWGNGDGSTTFNLPDTARRVAVGSGGTGTATLGNAVGNIGGEENHTLTTAEMPSHPHAAGSLTVSIPKANGAESVNAVTPDTLGGGNSSALANFAASGSTASAGGGNAHNIMQPSYVVAKIIKT